MYKLWPHTLQQGRTAHCDMAGPTLLLLLQDLSLEGPFCLLLQAVCLRFSRPFTCLFVQKLSLVCMVDCCGQDCSAMVIHLFCSSVFFDFSVLVCPPACHLCVSSVSLEIPHGRKGVETPVVHQPLAWFQRRA